MSKFQYYAAIIGMWTVTIGAMVVISVAMWHLLTPASWHWL